MTTAQKQNLQITNQNQILYNADTIYGMLGDYASRFIIGSSVNDFLTKWSTFLAYKKPDLIKAYSAVYADYNPLENYSKHESTVEVKNDGDTTRTHEPDKNHNTTTTTTSYDYTTENIQDAANKPTTEHYVSTFEGSEKLESKNVSQGKTTTNYVTNDDTTQTVTDDHGYSDTESHSTITTTWDNTSYTADSVKGTKRDITGVNNISNQELIMQSLDVAAQSLIYTFISEFIYKYTFYAFGGDEYVL